MSWFVRPRPKGDTSTEAVAVEVHAPTSADAIDRVRAMLLGDRIVTSVACY